MATRARRVAGQGQGQGAVNADGQPRVAGHGQGAGQPGVALRGLDHVVGGVPAAVIEESDSSDEENVTNSRKKPSLVAERP